MIEHSTLPRLVLASTSPYRKELLGRLGIAFQTVAPEVDETPLPGEQPRPMVARLAERKARAAAARFPAALIIGSDQVAVLDGKMLGKPGDQTAAMRQLRRASERTLEFLTGLCLLNSATGRLQIDVIPFSVTFRRLDEGQIERYLLREQPYNCAGSFRSEGLGIALFESLSGSDPTSLMGLPLIRLVRMLEAEGLNPI